MDPSSLASSPVACRAKLHQVLLNRLHFLATYGSWISKGCVAVAICSTNHMICAWVWYCCVSVYLMKEWVSLLSRVCCSLVGIVTWWKRWDQRYEFLPLIKGEFALFAFTFDSKTQAIIFTKGCINKHKLHYIPLERSEQICFGL